MAPAKGPKHILRIFYIDTEKDVCGLITSSDLRRSVVFRFHELRAPCLLIFDVMAAYQP